MRIAVAGEGQELNDEVPLSVAAQALGMSYLQAYNALLVGRLQGRRSKGRWLVTTECLKSSPISQPTAGHSGRARGP